MSPPPKTYTCPPSTAAWASCWMSGRRARSEPRAAGQLDDRRGGVLRRVDPAEQQQRASAEARHGRVRHRGRQHAGRGNAHRDLGSRHHRHGRRPGAADGDHRDHRPAGDDDDGGEAETTAAARTRSPRSFALATPVPPRAGLFARERVGHRADPIRKPGRRRSCGRLVG